MKAKYNGFCKVTGKNIVAGVTEIEKVNGQWQVAGAPAFVARYQQFANVAMSNGISDDEMAAMEENDTRYESEIAAAAAELSAMFPDVTIATFASAIRNISDPFGKPVRFSSVEKQNAFNAVMKKYNL